MSTPGSRYPLFPGSAPFLSATELLRAIDGNADSDRPLAEWARALGSLYRDWLAEPADVRIGRQIATVVRDIDSWLSSRLPRPRPGVPRGTDSVGGVIGRVAEAAAAAHWTLHDAQDTIARHHAWEHLAEMRAGYEDLVEMVSRGLIHLPRSWPAISWPGITTAVPREAGA
ncbi:hypothetical protein [Nocardia sp. NPDC057668]|uniref:hypothetical protein n=1 Tax=Nocardia sp. NPDC057668 TaxID=3346202 RepID=UPI00366F1756